MADAFSDARLEAILASVGEHLVVEAPAAPSVSPWPRRLAIAAVIFLAVLVAVVAVAPVREAVADWLGIGSTHIRRVVYVDTTGLPSIQERLTPVSRDEAEAMLRAPLPDVAALGDPELIVVAPEGGVIMGWSKGGTTLWVHARGLDPGPFFDKLVATGERVERVTDVGDDALYVEGTHILETPGRKLAARSVLLWIDGDVEYRLESNLDQAEMISIAQSVSVG